jgi:hypothetical protein
MSGPSVAPSGRPVPQRTLEIRRILDARFSLSVFEEWKRGDPAWWDSASNDIGRSIYGRAMRELRRLESASDGELDAELDTLAR